MAPLNPKVAAAYRAMAALGIDESLVKPVLKKLLKLYDRNWELIEEENYRALADAIFDEAEKNEPEPKKIPEKKKKSKKVHEEEVENEEDQMNVEPDQPLKRLRLKGQESQPSNPSTSSAPSSTATPLKEPKLEDDTLPENCSRPQPQNTALSSGLNARVDTALSSGLNARVDTALSSGLNARVDTALPSGLNARVDTALPSGLNARVDTALSSGLNARVEARSVSARDVNDDKGKQPVSPELAPRRKRRLILESEKASQSSKEPTVKPGMLSLPSNTMPHNHALIIPKDEPVDELPDSQVPLAVIPPGPSSARHSSKKNSASVKQNGHFLNDGATSSVEIASSTEGEVNMYLSFTSAAGELDICMPTREQILKLMEDKCLWSSKITDPNFSVPELLKDLCDCMWEFIKGSNNDSQEGPIMSSRADDLKESEANGTLSAQGNKELDMFSLPSNGSIDANFSAALLSPRSPFSLTHRNGQVDAVLISKDALNNMAKNDDRMELEDPMSPNSHSLVVVPQGQLKTGVRSLNVNDITRGCEIVKISWVNTITDDFPLHFLYITQNLVFKDAYVRITMAAIKDKDCCASCKDNCVLMSTSCACANKTGGGFAYSVLGLLKEQFLEECIAIRRNPQQHYFYCKDCPLESSENDGSLEPCKGHLKQNFIKECSVKCGCHKQCGNRVVQRGITTNLQVFFTSEGKGWGLRTLEDLPKGAFVCEFVGEILTIRELHERNMKSAENGKHTYPVLLDADWDSGFLKDEKALCLDATSFGNTARFINHRCFDANLIEIPVEIECPDHHYYHIALFTCRKVKAQEELTRDYGIQFDDHDHPVKLFQCKCGSKFCRDMKQSNRSLGSSSNAK